LTIIAYAGAVIVEAIAGRRPSRVSLAETDEGDGTIERLHDHFIICGYGPRRPPGRRGVFALAGVPYVVLDFREGRDRGCEGARRTC